jgi:hypothetical protein
MSRGTYNFFCLGVAVRHGPQVSHSIHLSSPAEMRYWGLTSLLALRGPMCLGLSGVGVGARIAFLGMVLDTFLEVSLRKVVEHFTLYLFDAIVIFLMFCNIGLMSWLGDISHWVSSVSYQSPCTRVGFRHLFFVRYDTSVLSINTSSVMLSTPTLTSVVGSV